MISIVAIICCNCISCTWIDLFVSIFTFFVKKKGEPTYQYLFCFWQKHERAIQLIDFPRYFWREWLSTGFCERIRPLCVTACQPNDGWKVTIAPLDGMRDAMRCGFRASLNPSHSFLYRFCRIYVFSWGLPSAALESRTQAYSWVADPSALAVWGEERAPRRVWSKKASRSRKINCGKLEIVKWFISSPFSPGVDIVSENVQWIPSYACCFITS